MQDVGYPHTDQSREEALYKTWDTLTYFALMLWPLCLLLWFQGEYVLFGSDKAWSHERKINVIGNSWNVTE